MTIKNKTEETKKETTDPAPAPNDDLVYLYTLFYETIKVLTHRKYLIELMFTYSQKKINASKKNLICWLKSLWYVFVPQYTNFISSLLP